MGIKIDELQKEIQRIYEEKIADKENSINMGIGENIILSLSSEEYRKIRGFFDMFAY